MFIYRVSLRLAQKTLSSLPRLIVVGSRRAASTEATAIATADTLAANGAKRVVAHKPSGPTVAKTFKNKPTNNAATDGKTGKTETRNDIELSKTSDSTIDGTQNSKDISPPKIDNGKSGEGDTVKEIGGLKKFGTRAADILHFNKDRPAYLAPLITLTLSLPLGAWLNKKFSASETQKELGELNVELTLLKAKYEPQAKKNKKLGTKVKQLTNEKIQMEREHKNEMVSLSHEVKELKRCADKRIFFYKQKAFYEESWKNAYKEGAEKSIFNNLLSFFREKTKPTMRCDIMMKKESDAVDDSICQCGRL